MTETFASLKITGGLLPSDVIGKIYAGDSDVPGIGPQTYGLEPGESVRRQASRVWQYLLEKWQEFRTRAEASPEQASARVTRERWLHILLRELGFGQLTAVGGIDLGGKSYPVSHQFGSVPVHLLGWRVSLDHRTPQVTARPPQAMLQELLNRSDDFLWALLSNGSVLRLLRDSTVLVGQAYIEFDLEAIFDGEIFSDFVRMYLICHASRFVPVGDGGPASCYLEQWRAFAADQGQRALAQLRRGVEQAISLLGTGFLAHPDNQHLRGQLDPRSGRLRIEDFNRSLLRLAYRLLFWFVAEDRDVLLDPIPPDADAETSHRMRLARQRYETYFSSARLRKLARVRRGDRHGDLYESIQIVFAALGSEGGVPQLGLPGIGGIFETELPSGQTRGLDEPLAGARLSNQALLSTVRALAIVTSRDGGGRRPVDFGNLGAEELGSVYEGLLEQVPRYNDETREYTLETLPGHERKETGSYYTPSPLVDCLLDSALDPLLDEACARPAPAERIEALLAISVCDPACGSGHFLVAAARRIAKRIAAEETGESEPPDTVVRTALRRVVGRCIYGVDINPMAAELAKVSLWMEAMEPGKPLSFLDQNIRVGNSLLGVTPALLAEGLPDAAFKPLEGDDRKVVTALRKQNAEERSGQRDLFSPGGIDVSNAVLARRAAEITRAVPDSLEDLHIHQQRLAQELAGSGELRHAKLVADAWCAAFVQPKNEDTRTTVITQAVLEQLAGPGGTLELAQAEEEIERLGRQYRFFHWHVEFPHIFRAGDAARDVDRQTGWDGGFSCVIGNPPWERVKLQEQEFFAARDPSIAKAPNAAARKKLIERLGASEEEAERALYRAFRDELRTADGWSHLLRDSGRYPLTGRGDVNTYAVFSETAGTVIGPRGRSGLVLPTGIATDATTAPFFGALVRTSRLVSFLEFENEAFLLNRDVDHRVRFCLLTVCGRAVRVAEASFAFGTRYIRDLAARRFAMPPEEILLVNPNTGTTPVFRSRRDAEITIGIYRRVPVLWRDDPQDNPWGMSFMAMFHMANDSGLFRTFDDLDGAGWRLSGNVFARGDERMLPLYEAKMIRYYDHRLGTYEGQTQAQANVGTLPRPTREQQDDPDFAIRPRYWVAEEQVDARLAGRWDRDWLLGWRDITNATNERTMICSVMPRTAMGHVLPLALSTGDADLLCACWSSFVLDYVVRQKIAGTHMTFFNIKQLPVPRPDTFSASAPWSGQCSLAVWIRARVLELSYSSYDMTPFARDLGDDGPPFHWDEERRFAMRAELDAAFFHVYGIDRDDAKHVMETFPIVKRRDIERHGSFRTKEVILQVYDAMAKAERDQQPYQTILDPPPGHGPRHPAL
ncbi:MAG TPA: N-6 DNA methylase [Streptosporangiaceae bacterium]|nr:N-6 DNA methylase [Streptosporangiaceae bacterium]